MIALLLSFAWIGSAEIREDPRTDKGFDHFYNLEYDQAIAEFRRLVSIDPQNPSFHNHVAQAVLYREMLRGGALESELVSGNNPFLSRAKLATSAAAEEEFNSSLSKAMQIAEARLAKDANDSAALYAMGVSHALRANYNFLVRKAWMDSLKDATAARKAHNRVIELNPGDTDALLLQGLHDYIVGSLPFHMKFIGFIAGFRGDREAGIETLQMVARKGMANRHDAQVLLAAIYRREKKSELALPLLNEVITRFPRNYLFRLETVQMYSDLGQKEEALAALARIEELKQAGSPGFARLPMEKIHYYRGNLLFWYDELDKALVEMRKATGRPDALDIHTAVLAWMRLGQINDMKGRRSDAVSAYKQAVSLAPDSDVGKESKRYVSSPYKRG